MLQDIERMRTMHINLERTMVAQLREIARQDERPVSVVIRRLLRQALERKEGVTGGTAR